MQLKICNVTKKYGQKIAVEQFSADFENGVYGLLGANGAGKSTLMKMLSCLLSPDSGHIMFNSRDIYEMKESYLECIGYLPQQFGYYPDFSAEDFLMYIAAVKGLSLHNIEKIISDTLDFVSLTDIKKQKIKTYSGGMKQRLGIACAIINNPKILILDEPTTGLDPKERVRFRNLISKLSQKKIVILSTHIVSDIEYIADKVLIIKNGKLLQQGEINDILIKLNGHIWECELDAESIKSVTEKYSVGNIKQRGDKMIVRIIADHVDIDGVKAAEPNLEDLYLFYFHEEKSGEF